MTTAVLVIDVQQGLCEGEKAAFDCEGTIKRINKVTDRARHAGIPIIFIQHETQTGFLAHGSKEWQLADGLTHKPGDTYVRKTTPDSFHRTDLGQQLEGKHANQLVICGMHTEFCVDTTIRRALALGFPVTLVSDGHTTAGNSVLSPQQVIGHHNETLTSISSFGVRVTAIPGANIKF